MPAPARYDHRPHHHILAVDDVPAQLQAVSTMLDRKGIDLRLATSGALALRSVAVMHPDLVLLDVALPDMDGYEVARRLRATDGFSDLPVIFITARAHPEDILNGFSAGAVDYVTKPFNAAELTARIVTHLELKRSRDAILHQNECLSALSASKDMFLSVVAHDMKNSLHGIISLSELLLDMGAAMDPAANRGYLSSLNATAEQMAKSLHELLEWARLQGGGIEFNPKIFPLASVVEESLLLTQGAAATKQVAAGSLVPEDEWVFADPIMILTVVRNLLQNAIKYSSRGGKVLIAAGPLDNGSVRVSVTDLGIGMRRSLLESLFRAESKGSRPGTEGERGTGLGLKFCQEFLAKHGSSLSVQSVEGKGTTFSFVLPRAMKG